MVIRGGSDVVVSGLLGRVQCWLLHVVHPVMLLVVAAGRVLDWSDVRTTTTHLRFIAARSVEMPTSYSLAGSCCQRVRVIASARC